LGREADAQALQVTEGGFERVSGVTDVEQVSYVGSPYLPRCIRTQWGKEMTSNKHRSSESARGATTIKDDLSEAITLGCSAAATRSLCFCITAHCPHDPSPPPPPFPLLPPQPRANIRR
jgi:hypothetical protein